MVRVLLSRLRIKYREGQLLFTPRAETATLWLVRTGRIRCAPSGPSAKGAQPSVRQRAVILAVFADA